MNVAGPLITNKIKQTIMSVLGLLTGYKRVNFIGVWLSANLLI